MGSIERLFLQSMLSRGAVTEKLARKVWQKCVEAVNATSNADQPIPFSDTDDDWQIFVNKINDSLDKLDLIFQHVHDQKTGIVVYSIINTKGDPIAQMATDYTPAEIAYFKAIVEQIILASRHKYSVSSLVALREVSLIRPKSNITKSQAEIVLGTFVAKGWLIKSKDGRYSLSTRSLLELKPYLQSNYPDYLLNCTICDEIVTTGISCHHTGCKVHIHPHCFERYRRRYNNCPKCKNDWPRDINNDAYIPIGDKAVRKGEIEERVSMEADGESDYEENLEEVMDQSQSQSQSQSGTQSMQPQTQKNGKLKGKAPKGKRVEDEEDGEEDASPAPTQTQTRQRRSTRR